MNIYINNKKYNNKNNLKSKEKRTNNFANKNKNKSKIKININNSANPVDNNIPIQIIEVKHNIQIKNNKNHQINKKDIYNKNKDISYMNQKPPQLPSLFNHNYNLENKNIQDCNYNKIYGKLNKETIPNNFYNHLMIDVKNKNIVNNKNKFYKASITSRNQKKILTILYYYPKA